MSAIFGRGVAAAGLLLLSMGIDGVAHAQRGPAPQWCVRTYDGANDCSYFSFAQCQSAVSATGGDCAINPRFTGYPDRAYRSAPRTYR